MTTEIDLSILEKFISEQKHKLQHEKQLLQGGGVPRNSQSPQIRSSAKSRAPTQQQPTAVASPRGIAPQHDRAKTWSSGGGGREVNGRCALDEVSGALVPVNSSDDGFFDQMGNSVVSKRERIAQEMNTDMQAFLEKQRRDSHPRLKKKQSITHSPASNTELIDDVPSTRRAVLTLEQQQRQKQQENYRRELESQIAKRKQRRQQSLDDLLAPNSASNATRVVAPWDRDRSAKNRQGGPGDTVVQSYKPKRQSYPQDNVHQQRHDGGDGGGKPDSRFLPPGSRQSLPPQTGYSGGHPLQPQQFQNSFHGLPPPPATYMYQPSPQFQSYQSQLPNIAPVSIFDDPNAHQGQQSQQQSHFPQQFHPPPGIVQQQQQFHGGPPTAMGRPQIARPMAGGPHMGQQAAGGRQPPGGQSNTSGQRQDPTSYREDLERQVAETKAKKEAEKQKRDAEDARVAREAEIYDPYGKGGAGAPLKTASGNVVADLRKLHRVNEDALNDPTGGRKSYDRFDDAPRNKNMTYKDYLEEQIKVKEAKRAAEKQKSDDREQKDKARLVRQMVKIKEEYEQELLAEKEKNDAKEKDRTDKFRIIEESRLEAVQLRKQAIEEKRQAGKKEIAERIQQSSAHTTPTYETHDPNDDRPLDNGKKQPQQQQRAPVQPRSASSGNSVAGVQQPARARLPPAVPIRSNQASPEVYPVESASKLGPLVPPAAQAQLRYYQSRRHDLQSRDSMVDVNAKRRDVGRELSALKRQLQAEKDKVEQQISKSNHVKIRNMNTYRLPTRDYIRTPSTGVRGLGGFANVPNQGGYPGYSGQGGVPPRFKKQATKVSLLDAETKFMPVGDLDFDIPGQAESRIGDIDADDDDDQDVDTASITTAQIDALAERNKERVARLKQWKAESDANNHNLAPTENPDEVIDRFKERIERLNNSQMPPPQKSADISPPRSRKGTARSRGQRPSSSTNRSLAPPPVPIPTESYATPAQMPRASDEV